MSTLPFGMPLSPEPPSSSPYFSSIGLKPSARELNSDSTQNVRWSFGRSPICDSFVMPPSSSTASLRTANAYVLFIGAGFSQVRPLPASSLRTACHCSVLSGMPSLWPM